MCSWLIYVGSQLEKLRGILRTFPSVEISTSPSQVGGYDIIVHLKSSGEYVSRSNDFNVVKTELRRKCSVGFN